MTTAMANRCAEIRIRAERKAGEMIRASDISPGRKTYHDGRFTLGSLGISHNQSSRWQKLANIPEETIEQYFAEPENRYRD